MNTVYHFGYSAHDAPERIEALMQDEHMLLIDTRKVPYSWRFEWQCDNLKRRYGARYRQAGRCLGNLNFKGGPIKIVDIDTGIRGLMMYLKEGHDLILLCQCAHTRCHRYVIIDALKQAMPEVEIVESDCVPAQQPPDTLLCLSVQQPWSHLIVNKFKDVENRDWTTSYRGPLLIHAGAKYDPEWFDKGQYISQYYLDRFELDGYVPYTKEGYPTGALVGIVDLVDVVTSSKSPWFVGKYGFVLANARPIEPIPYRGALKLFPVPLEALKAVIPEVEVISSGALASGLDVA